MHGQNKKFNKDTEAIKTKTNLIPEEYNDCTE